MTVVNYTPEQWQAAFERADDRALEYEARARAANARVAELEAALRMLHKATDPWMENAPPGEQMTEAWAATFSTLGAARVAAVDALAPKGKGAD